MSAPREVWVNLYDGHPVHVWDSVRSAELQQGRANQTYALAKDRRTIARFVHESELAALRAERDALRELMNVYNVGGWTDAIAPMQRALASEAKVEALEKEKRTAVREALDAVIEMDCKGILPTGRVRELRAKLTGEDNVR